MKQQNSSMLAKAAKKLIAAKKKALKKEMDEKSAAQAKKEFKILQEFEIGFAKELPLLKDAGISYSAHYNSQYDHEGTYIKFCFVGQELKMDFSARNSYRYEYTGRRGEAGNYGRMVFGDWNKEDFILFIYTGLIVKK